MSELVNKIIQKENELSGMWILDFYVYSVISSELITKLYDYCSKNLNDKFNSSLYLIELKQQYNNQNIFTPILLDTITGEQISENIFYYTINKLHKKTFPFTDENRYKNILDTIISSKLIMKGNPYGWVLNSLFNNIANEQDLIKILKDMQKQGVDLKYIKYKQISEEFNDFWDRNRKTILEQ